MVQISKRKLPDHVLEKLFKLFFKTIGEKDDQEEFQQIINDIFSTTERIMIAKRIAIVYLLLKGINHETISDVLKVSSSTVAKFSLLMEKSEGVVSYLKSITTKEKITEFFGDLFHEVFLSPGTPGINWSAAWKTKLERERKKREGI